MKNLIICTAAVLTLLKLPYLNVGIAVNGEGYYIENGNAAIIVESPLYGDVEPLAMFVIN